MDVHPPKNGIFIGIDPGCHMFPQFLFHKSSHFRWPQDFIQILDDVGDLVASQLRRLSSASVAVRRAAKAMGCGVERVLLGALEMQNPRCCCCWWWWCWLFVGFLLTFCWLVVDFLLIYWMLWASVVKQNPELKSGQLFFSNLEIHYLQLPWRGKGVDDLDFHNLSF